MTNQLKIIGEPYKKFGLKHTSKSTATLPHTIRFFKKHCLNPNEANKLSNASLHGGTVIHLIVQECLTKKVDVDAAFNKKEIQDKINYYTPYNDKDKKKYEMIIKFAKETANNHLENIKELDDQEWQDELEYTVWTPPVQTYWLCFIDLIGKTDFGDLKNKFGQVRETKKGLSYTSVKMPDRPFYSDLMQIALYKKCCPLKPFLSYASHTDRKLFTEKNCEDLKQKNLDKCLKQLMVYEIAWQKKLECADGDINKLAWLCPPDFSDIKKDSFWYQGVPQEYIERYLNYYEL
jgi:hypothetical protein|tara:strand:- start:2811 stop:3683 length:873 start_codon:yes stop_codon:yes gene_type:complete